MYLLPIDNSERMNSNRYLTWNSLKFYLAVHKWNTNDEWKPVQIRSVPEKK